MLWAPKPHSILSWTIFPREKTTFFYLFQQSGNNPAYLPFCNDTFILAVNYEDSHLLITLQRESHLIDHIFSNLLNLSSPKKFVQTYQQYTSNIWSVLADYEAIKAKGKAPARREPMAPLNEGTGSGTARSGMASLEDSPTTTRKRPNTNPTSSGRKGKKSKSNLGGSSVTYLNPTINHATSEMDIDYAAAAKTLTEFWTKCEPCYVLGRMSEPVLVPVDLLEFADAKYIVRKLEPTGIVHYKNILINAIDLYSRQTIIIMPMINEAPEVWDWDTLLATKCKFCVIDG